MKFSDFLLFFAFFVFLRFAFNLLGQGQTTAIYWNMGSSKLPEFVEMETGLLEEETFRVVG